MGYVTDLVESKHHTLPEFPPSKTNTNTRKRQRQRQRERKSYVNVLVEAKDRTLPAFPPSIKLDQGTHHGGSLCGDWGHQRLTTTSLL